MTSISILSFLEKNTSDWHEKNKKNIPLGMPVCGVSQAFTDEYQVSLVEAQAWCPTYIEFLNPREGAVDSEV